MVELFKHLFGLCGDGHPSILCLLGITPFIVCIKNYFNSTILSLKTFLKRLY